MLFNSFQFLWLFPLIFIAYYLVNRLGGGKWSSCRVSNFALLVLSYGLYLQWNPVCACVLMYVTVVTFLGGIVIPSVKKQRKVVLWCFVLSSDSKYVNNAYLWKDLTHMNVKGADMFTNELIEKLKSGSNG